MNARMRRNDPSFPQPLDDNIADAAFRVAIAQAEQAAIAQAARDSRPSFYAEPLHPGMTAVCRHCGKLIIVVDMNVDDHDTEVTRRFALHEDLQWRHVGTHFYSCNDAKRLGLPMAEPYIGQSEAAR